MYEIEKANYVPNDIYAGDYPVEIGIEEAKADLEKNTVVALKAGKLEAISAENLADIYGVTADEAKAGNKVAIYLTGDLRAEAVKYGTSNLETVKVPLRKLGIFLK